LTNTDNSVVQADIGFNFNFYGNSYSKIFVTSNGLLSFQSQSNDGGYPDNFNSDLTGNVGPNRPLIAALWDDWLTNVSAADQVYLVTLGTPGNRRFVVQWDQVTGYANSPTTVTFEAALFESDGRIEFRYKDVIAGDGLASYFRDNGQDATIGIRSGFPGAPPGVLYADGKGALPNGVDGIQVGFDSGASNLPAVQNGMTIAFAPGNVPIANFPPTIAITGAPTTSPEGTRIDLGSSVVDPNITRTANDKPKGSSTAPAFIYDWSVTRDSSPFTTGLNTATNGPAFSFTPPDNGNYVVTLTVTDSVGAMNTTSTAIRVTNVAPVVDVGTAMGVASSNANFDRTIRFTDPGSDTWSVKIDYGNGVTNSFDLTPGSHGFDPVAKTFLLSYSFHTDTTYNVSVTITDKDGGSNTETFPVAVFDPNEFARIVAFAIGVADESGTGTVDLNTGLIHLDAALANGHEGDSVAVTVFNSDPTSDANQITAPGTIPVTGTGDTTGTAKPVVFLDTRAVTNADAKVQQVYEFTLPDALATNNIQLFWFDKVTNRWQLVTSQPGNGDTIEIFPILDAAGHRTGNSRVRLTRTFGNASSPATGQLTGTVFSIAIPVGGSGSSTTFVVLPTALASNAPGIGAGIQVETSNLGNRSNFALVVQETQTPLPAAGAVTDADSSVDQILNWLLNGDLRRRPGGPEPEQPPADGPQSQQPAVPRPPGGGGMDDEVDSTTLAELFAAEADIELAVEPADFATVPVASEESTQNKPQPVRQVDPRRLHAGLVLASLLAGAGAVGRPRPRNGKRYKPTLQTSGTP